jgi:hypothetical protein
VSSLFFLFNLDKAFFQTDKINKTDKTTYVKPLNSQIPSFTNSMSYLVVGNPGSSSEELIKDNILRVLSDLKLDYGYSENLSQGQLKGNKTIIFCITDVSKSIDLGQLSHFIRNGGRVIFAAGIPSNNLLAYLYPIWGIVELGSHESFNNIKFNEGSIPYDETLIENSPPTYAINARLAKTCTVLVEASNTNPLIWTNNYSSGKCAVINGTFMESKLSEGILVLALANLEDSFIYPIIGAKTVFLDAIPPLFNSNDENSFNYYGRSSDSFVRDRLWGVLLQKSKLYNLKYTTSFLAVDKSNIDMSYANKQSFSFINKEIIQNEGELTLAGDHNGLYSISATRSEAIKKYFEELFPKYNIHAYYPLYGKSKFDDFKELKTTFKNLSIYRCYYYGNPEEQTVGNFEVLDKEGVVSYPTITYGYKSQGLNMYNFISLLTSKGVISHSFDTNSLFTVPETESNWNTLDDDYDNLNVAFFKKTPWLESMTISPAARIIQAMEKLEYKIKTIDNKMILYSNNIVPGQKFMFFSIHKPLKITGGTYKQINKYYYMISVQETELTIEF